MADLLTVNGLSKSYGEFALRDVSFHVEAGLITGFIGKNGAGKTTTIRVLLGLSPDASGEISYFGTGCSGLDPRVRARLGVVLDSGGFFEDLTAGQMKSVLAPAYARWNEADFRRYMEMFSLDPKQKISEFSRGMRAKFALALAMSHRADLLIMDEPTGGLDPIIRRELLESLQDYIKSGERAVLFSTHITSDLDRVADDIVMINDGKIVFQENKDELLDRYRLVKGRTAALTPAVRTLVMDLHETPFGFTGITNDAEALRLLAPDIVTERATIEDIMAAHTGETADTSQAKGSENRVPAFV